jgi:hypothetical protein
MPQRMRLLWSNADLCMRYLHTDTRIVCVCIYTSIYSSTSVFITFDKMCHLLKDLAYVHVRACLYVCVCTCSYLHTYIRTHPRLLVVWRQRLASTDSVSDSDSDSSLFASTDSDSDSDSSLLASQNSEIVVQHLLSSILRLGCIIFQ